MTDSPCRKPDGPYLIESAPNFQQYRAAKAAREIAQRIKKQINEAAATLERLS